MDPFRTGTAYLVVNLSTQVLHRDTDTPTFPVLAIMAVLGVSVRVRGCGRAGGRQRHPGTAPACYRVSIDTTSSPAHNGRRLPRLVSPGSKRPVAKRRISSNEQAAALNG
jgi:hypothetical protein